MSPLGAPGSLAIQGSVDIDVQGAKQALKSLDQQVGGFSKGSILKFGGIAAAVAGVVGASRGLGTVVQGFAQVDQKLAVVGVKMGASAEQMKALRGEVKQIGIDTTKTADETAEALDIMATAGLTADQALASLGATVRFSEATGHGMAESVKIASGALNVFGLDAAGMEDAMNALAAAGNSTATTIGELGNALETGQGTWAETGDSLDNMLVGLGILAKEAKTGAKAGTQLARAVFELRTPRSVEAAAMLEQLGINAFTAAGESRKASDVLRDLVKSLEGTTDAQKQQALSTVFGGDALKAVLPIVNQGVAGWDAMAKAQAEAAGVAELSAARMDTLAGSFDFLEGTVVTVLQNAFEPFAPLLKQSNQALAGLIDNVSGKAQPHLERFAKAMIALTNLTGPDLTKGLRKWGLAITDGFKQEIEPLAKVLGNTWRGTLTAIFGQQKGTGYAAYAERLTSNLGHLFGRIMDDAGRLVRGDFEQFGEDTNEDLHRVLSQLGVEMPPDFLQLGRAFSSYFGDIRTAVGVGLDDLAEQWRQSDTFIEGIIRMARASSDAFADAEELIAQGLQELGDAFLEWTGIKLPDLRIETLSEWKDAALSVLGTVWGQIRDGFRGHLTRLGLIRENDAIWGDLGSKLWGGLGNIMNKGLELLGGIGGDFGANLDNIVRRRYLRQVENALQAHGNPAFERDRQTALQGISADPTSDERIKAFTKTLSDTLEDAWQAILGGIEDSPALSGLRDTMGTAWDWLEDFVDDVPDMEGVKAIFTNAGRALEDGWKELQNVWKPSQDTLPASPLFPESVMAEQTNPLAQRILDTFSAVNTAIKGAAGAVWDGVTDEFDKGFQSVADWWADLDLEADHELPGVSLPDSWTTVLDAIKDFMASVSWAGVYLSTLAQFTMPGIAYGVFKSHTDDIAGNEGIIAHLKSSWADVKDLPAITLPDPAFSNGTVFVDALDRMGEAVGGFMDRVSSPDPVDAGITVNITPNPVLQAMVIPPQPYSPGPVDARLTVDVAPDPVLQAMVIPPQPYSPDPVDADLRVDVDPAAHLGPVDVPDVILDPVAADMTVNITPVPAVDEAGMTVPPFGVPGVHVDLSVMMDPVVTLGPVEPPDIPEPPAQTVGMDLLIDPLEELASAVVIPPLGDLSQTEVMALVLVPDPSVDEEGLEGQVNTHTAAAVSGVTVQDQTIVLPLGIELSIPNLTEDQVLGEMATVLPGLSEGKVYRMAFTKWGAPLAKGTPGAITKGVTTGLRAGDAGAEMVLGAQRWMGVKAGAQAAGTRLAAAVKVPLVAGMNSVKPIKAANLGAGLGKLVNSAQSSTAVGLASRIAGTGVSKMSGVFELIGKSWMGKMGRWVSKGMGKFSWATLAAEAVWYIWKGFEEGAEQKAKAIKEGASESEATWQGIGRGFAVQIESWVKSGIDLLDVGSEVTASLINFLFDIDGFRTDLIDAFKTGFQDNETWREIEEHWRASTVGRGFIATGDWFGGLGTSIGGHIATQWTKGVDLFKTLATGDYIKLTFLSPLGSAMLGAVSGWTPVAVGIGLGAAAWRTVKDGFGKAKLLSTPEWFKINFWTDLFKDVTKAVKEFDFLGTVQAWGDTIGGALKSSIQNAFDSVTPEWLRTLWGGLFGRMAPAGPGGGSGHNHANVSGAGAYLGGPAKGQSPAGFDKWVEGDSLLQKGLKWLTGRATGGRVRPGEITLVGEKGPEIVSLPPGSFVHPTGTGPEMPGLDEASTAARWSIQKLTKELDENALATMGTVDATMRYSDVQKETLDTMGRGTDKLGDQAKLFGDKLATVAGQIALAGGRISEAQARIRASNYAMLRNNPSQGQDLNRTYNKLGFSHNVSARATKRGRRVITFEGKYFKPTTTDRNLKGSKYFNYVDPKEASALKDFTDTFGDGPTRKVVEDARKAKRTIAEQLQNDLSKRAKFGDPVAKAMVPRATGGVVGPGEVTMVGERGPELVRLPPGSRVYPNGQGPSTTHDNSSNDTYNITLVDDGSDALSRWRNEVAFRKFARR